MIYIYKEYDQWALWTVDTSLLGNVGTEIFEGVKSSIYSNGIDISEMVDSNGRLIDDKMFEMIYGLKMTRKINLLLLNQNRAVEVMPGIKCLEAALVAHLIKD